MSTKKRYLIATAICAFCFLIIIISNDFRFVALVVFVASVLWAAFIKCKFCGKFLFQDISLRKRFASGKFTCSDCSKQKPESA
jgi:hypothetical protein